jgi:hypothetical protein
MRAELSSEYGTVYVWPWCPRVPMLEALEWYTDVFTSHNGADQAVRYRNAPRRSFEVTTVLPWPYSTRGQNAMMEGAAEPWVLGMWAETTDAGSLTVGAGSIAVDTATSAYIAGGLALVYGGMDAWEVVEIDTVGAGMITLAGTLAASYDSARVMPARVGRILQVPSFRLNRKHAVVTFWWQSDENEERTPAEPAQYQGDDFDDRCPLLDGDGVEDGYLSRVDIMDEITGLVSTSAPWTRNRRTRAHRVFNAGRTESWEFREWLHRRAGQHRQVWMPTWTRDLRLLSTGALTTTIDVADDAYGLREHVAVRTTAGAWVLREVTLVEVVSPGILRLTLDTSLAIDADDVEFISYLALHRLAADRIEIQHMGNGQTQSVVPLMEVAG